MSDPFRGRNRPVRFDKVTAKDANAQVRQMHDAGNPAGAFNVMDCRVCNTADGRVAVITPGAIPMPMDAGHARDMAKQIRELAASPSMTNHPGAAAIKPKMAEVVTALEFAAGFAERIALGEVIPADELTALGFHAMDETVYVESPRPTTLHNSRTVN